MQPICLSPKISRFLPPHGRGQRIGLLGGSFNPAHGAHRLISLIALRRLKLDAIWWLVTPGNPLKSIQDLPDIQQRMAQARALAHHPKIHVSGCEQILGTRYTIDSLKKLLPRAANIHFIWIMGSDNLLNFHQWKQWAAIARLMPIAVIDRPGTTIKSLQGRTAQRFRAARLPESQASATVLRKAPAWVFVHDRRSPLSSTALRQQTKPIH